MDTKTFYISTILIVSLLILCASCSKNDNKNILQEDSKFLGTYSNPLETLSITAQGEFFIFGECSYQGFIEPVNETDGNYDLRVFFVSGTKCIIQPATYSCFIELTEPDLFIACGTNIEFNFKRGN